MKYKKKKQCYIYSHHNPTTKEIFYIGIGINDRAYKFSGGRNKDYLVYIKQHGTPIVEIIKENLSKKQACLLEIELITKYGRKGIEPNGILLNKSIGGQLANLGNKHTQETREKISKSNLGKSKHSEEQKEKWRLERKGRKNNTNPNHVKADKGRKKPKGFGSIRERKVLQFDLEGNLIKEWKSFREIFDQTQIRCSSIWANITGKTKQSRGFIWKYK